MNKKFIFLILSIPFFCCMSQPIKSEIYVDSSGIMRWQDSKSEVSLFGVNYTVPFAYSYRAHKKLNLDLKKAIDIDVSQMVRLGLSAFRVHVWDREISDRDGNLLENEHLDLFDYLLNKLAENGIKSIITPIAWWGTGWPEPDYDTPGFSTFYSKVEMIIYPKAREAQRNYLKQFINHINAYNKLSYKNDPSVIAVEIINEPRHPDNVILVTEYINEMYDIIRSSGFNKPIFYNISENWNDEQAKAVVKSKAEGISFQWYPTGLVHNNELKGNYLMNVNKYNIPSDSIQGYNKKAKMVYEFDAADIGKSYMYPAMARSFREAGMQFAAMFCYDPTQIAWSNTEYPTHFLNLLYTPSKAISLMIAAKVFVNTPLYKNYGDYPVNNSFSNFVIDYENNLSEMNSENEFYYSNSTKALPKDKNKLEHIAGCGYSSIVNYNGTGAYFLDKIKEGIWLLEINPDVIWVDDPFGKTSLKREVARLFWNKSNMNIDLPDLQGDFYCYSLNDSPALSLQSAKNKTIEIKPGLFLLSNKVLNDEFLSQYSNKAQEKPNLFIPDFGNEIFVMNYTKAVFNEADSIKFGFTIASDREIEEAVLYLKRIGWRGFEKHLLTKVDKYSYEANVSSQAVKNGMIEYCVSIKQGKETITFPGKKTGNPSEWDFNSINLWQLKVFNNINIIQLFDPKRDNSDLIFQNFSRDRKYLIDYKFDTLTSELALVGEVQFSGYQSIPFGFMLNVSELIKIPYTELQQFNNIIIKGKTLSKENLGMKIALLLKSGENYQSKFFFKEELREIEIPLSSFTKGDRLLLPDSYPLFLPKNINIPANNSGKLTLTNLDFIQILIDESFTSNSGNNSLPSFEIKSIYLTK
jgi:hypothetical protein